MRALLILAAAVGVFAAASPTVPVDGGLGGPGLDAGIAVGLDAGPGERESLLRPRKERPACPPAQASGPHCVYLTLKKPSMAGAEKLAKKLRTDGVESDTSDDFQVSVSLGDAQLAKLFGATVSYSLTGASASDRMVCDPQIASFKAPARYGEVASLRIDAQCP